MCLSGDRCFLLTESEYLPIYLECLYPYLSDSVCGAIRMQSEHGMEITSLRTNHKLFYSVLYLNHGELVCISDHMISVCTCTPYVRVYGYLHKLTK